MEGFSFKAIENLKIDESFFSRTIFRNQSFLLMVWFNLIFSFMPRSLKFTHDTNLFLPFHHLFPTGIFLVILLCFIYLFTPQVFASCVAKIIGKIIKLIHYIHLDPWFEIYFISFCMKIVAYILPSWKPYKTHFICFQFNGGPVYSGLDKFGCCGS